MPGLLKADFDRINGRVKSHINALIQEQLKKMQSTKVIMTLWVRWKKPAKSAITIDTEDVEDDMDVEGNTDDNYTFKPVYVGLFIMDYIGLFTTFP